VGCKQSKVAPPPLDATDIERLIVEVAAATKGISQDVISRKARERADERGIIKAAELDRQRAIKPRRFDEASKGKKPRRGFLGADGVPRSKATKNEVAAVPNAPCATMPQKEFKKVSKRDTGPATTECGDDPEAILAAVMIQSAARQKEARMVLRKRRREIEARAAARAAQTEVEYRLRAEGTMVVPKSWQGNQPGNQQVRASGNGRMSAAGLFPVIGC